MRPRKADLIKGKVRTGKKVWGGGGCREGVGHEVLSLVQGVARATYSYP